MSKFSSHSAWKAYHLRSLWFALLMIGLRWAPNRRPLKCKDSSAFWAIGCGRNGHRERLPTNETPTKTDFGWHDVRFIKEQLSGRHAANLTLFCFMWNWLGSLLSLHVISGVIGLSTANEWNAWDIVPVNGAVVWDIVLGLSGRVNLLRASR